MLWKSVDRTVTFMIPYACGLIAGAHIKSYPVWVAILVGALVILALNLLYFWLRSKR
jgi:hypothetical protein